MPSYSRSSGPRSHANRAPGGRVSRYNGVYLGYIKDNVDAQKMGRLRVWIPELGSPAGDKSGWITVSYCSPFGGVTNRGFLGQGSDKIEHFDYAQQSYGFWAVPPDLENQVLVTFANGDLSKGFWMGCVFNQYMNNMIPGVPSGNSYEDSSTPQPNTEYNKYETRSIDPTSDNTTRPYQKYYTEGIIRQGLGMDKVRGQSTSGARRESPSQVYGLLTPGPIDDGSQGRRKGGHQIMIDDGQGTEHIVLKTRGGSQIRLDETNGLIYITNRDGTGWVEITETGQIQVYGKGSVSIRSEEDVNIRADRDVNIESGRNTNIKAAKSYQAPASADKSAEILGDGAGEGGNIKIQALADMDTTVENNMRTKTNTGIYDLKVSTSGKLTFGANLDINVASTFLDSSATRGVKSGNFDVTTGGDVRGSANFIAGGSMYAQDFHTPSVGLNAHIHKHSVFVSPTNHSDDMKPPESGGSSSSASGSTAATASDAVIPSVVSKTNVLYENNALVYDKDTQTVQTVMSKFTSAEPCRDHENRGGQS